MRSANAEKWYGNLDTNQEFPLTNPRDKKNYVVVKTPVVRVAIARETQIVRASQLAKIQVFTPEDYDKLQNPRRVSGGKNRSAKVSIFDKNPKAEWRVIHDPTRPLAEPELYATVENDPPKRTRRTRQQILDEQAEAQAQAQAQAETNGEEVEDAL